MWHNLFIFCGLYVSKRLTTQIDADLEVCKATTLAAVFLLVSARALHLGIVSPTFVLVFWLSQHLHDGCRACRGPLVCFSHCGVAAEIAGFILIVGTNERAIEFARQIAGHPELGYHDRRLCG